MTYLVNPPTGAYGNGTLANITFRVKAEGKTHLPYYGSLLIHYNGTDDVEIEHNVFHGWFLSVFTILGDIDGDSSVDSPDLELFASSYGKMFGDPSYNWLADLDRDGVVESYDLYLLAQNYGKSVGP